MAQPATSPPDSDKKERAPRTEAILGIEEMDFLPPSPGRTSKITELLEQVKDGHPSKWLVIAKYEKSGAASAAASTQRAKYGPVEANGWEFANRQITGEDENGKPIPMTALFVRYSPDKIQPGKAEAWEKVRAEREAKRLEKKAAKDEKDAKREAKAERQKAAANA